MWLNPFVTMMEMLVIRRMISMMWRALFSLDVLQPWSFLLWPVSVVGWAIHFPKSPNACPRHGPASLTSQTLLKPVSLSKCSLRTGRECRFQWFHDQFHGSSRFWLLINPVWHLRPVALLGEFYGKSGVISVAMAIILSSSQTLSLLFWYVINHLNSV